MNKKSVLTVVTVSLLAAASLTLFVQGNEKTYDPENDPIISLSYLNGVFAPTYDGKISAVNDKTKELEATISTLEARITELEKTPEAPETPTEPEAAKPQTYEVICLNEGAKLLAKSPLELILRSGSAITVSITTNGVNDLSDGTELLNAEDIPLYHQLLVPRGNDGRGLQVTSAEAYIMVRGDYEIVE